MILINSGAFVITEIEEEYGKIPPCFLPIANKSLLFYQIKTLKKNFPAETIYLSLPREFKLNSINLDYIAEQNIRIINTDHELPLHKSILKVLKNIPNKLEDIKMLHGDNLLLGKISNKKNIIGLVRREDLYSTHEVTKIKKKEYIWSGYFNFSNKKFLINCLSKNNNFVESVIEYGNKFKLSRDVQQKWFDLGHVNTYFKSRSLIIGSRHFNSIKVYKNVIIKKSFDKTKINSEYLWYKNIPEHIKKYTPKIICYKNLKHISQYSIEYLPLNPLSEIFVFGRNPNLFWEKIFSIIRKLLFDLRKIKISNISEIKKNSNWLIDHKTKIRLSLISNNKLIDIDKEYFYDDNKCPSLRKISNICIKELKQNNLSPAIFHGDLCLSNILFNSRLDSIKIIDPRGIGKKNKLMIFGDQNYDLAKLTHSVVGMYDHIISGQYKLSNFKSKNMKIIFERDLRLKEIQNLFIKKLLKGKRLKKIMPQVILLFINMLPLHKEKPERQKAIFANCLRLYNLYIK